MPGKERPDRGAIWGRDNQHRQWTVQILRQHEQKVAKWCHPWTLGHTSGTQGVPPPEAYSRGKTQSFWPTWGKLKALLPISRQSGHKLRQVRVWKRWSGSRGVSQVRKGSWWVRAGMRFVQEAKTQNNKGTIKLHHECEPDQGILEKPAATWLVNLSSGNLWNLTYSV